MGDWGRGRGRGDRVTVIANYMSAAGHSAAINREIDFQLELVWSVYGEGGRGTIKSSFCCT